MRAVAAFARTTRPAFPRTTHARSTMTAAANGAAGGAPQGGLIVQPTEYPEVRRDASVVDSLHGVDVADPYRWLEDPDLDETRAFVDAQNVVTNAVLAQCGTRDAFKSLMTRLYDYPRYSCPSKQGERYVYSHNSGLQAQSVLYTQATPDGDATVLLDPNKLSDDGTVALGSTSFSEDGTMMAYTLSSGGSDWRTVHVLRVDQASGAPSDLPDKLEHAKFTSLAWTHDGKGFFYHRYPPPAKSGDLGTEVDSNVDKEMWYHVVGRPQSEDVFVYAVPEHPTWHIGGEVTDDGRYLLIAISSGCEPTNRLFVVDIDALPRGEDGILELSRYDRRSPDAEPLPIVKLVDNFDAAYDYVANEGSVMTFQTNLSAPRDRLVRTDIATPTPPETWADVVPEDAKDLLQWAAVAKGDALVTCYLRDVHSVLQLRSLRTGALVRVIPLPGLGSVSSSFKCKRKSSEVFFSYTSFTDPGSAFRIDLDTDAPPTLFRKTVLKGGFDPAADFETKQVFATSKDGTRVPMFVTAPKGVALDGSNPCLLYGYGGFNISLEPGFSVARLVFGLGYRGVVAVANLRGGGEYGIEWRNAGSRRHKQNVFDDFQACAQHLASEGWTSPAKLIIQGGSNGGLLVAACANQRPDLFACVLAQVGVHDMLRFHKFTIGHAWCTDYGTPDDADDFGVLLSYSPVHNVARPSNGGQYPAFMITTGDHDDRVVPLHSHKLTATLQHVMGGADSPQRNPLITRIDVRAGHGAGKPTDKIIAEVADMYAYAAAVVGATWQAPKE